MRVVKHTDSNFGAVAKSLNRDAAPSAEIENTVLEIIAQVREQGDAALLRFTAKFGGPEMNTGELRVSAAELRAAKKSVDAATKKAIATAHANVRDFARRSLRKNWSAKNAQGARVGERFDPFQRVGIYVPGGTAPLVSTAVMTCTFAQAAGVPEIVVTTPASVEPASSPAHPQESGGGDAAATINAALLYALDYAGATEIYKAGGAQAVAALAYGTETIATVQKIFGPGNAYVVEAKRQVFGRVAIDLLPGPSEILVIADASANAAWIAADMLAQAEHGKGSQIVFVTNSAKILAAVEREIATQLANLSRQQHLAGVLDRDCTLLLVKSLNDAVSIANAYAPEHVSIVARNDDALAAKITTAGAIFLGSWSPVVAGDFLAGPSHTLPTGGAGKSFPGLTADMFQRRTSIVRLDAKSLRKSLATIETFSRIEGLDAHGRSAAVRVES
jgi:histidinol dehydrogenase